MANKIRLAFAGGDYEIIRASEGRLRRSGWHRACRTDRPWTARASLAHGAKILSTIFVNSTSVPISWRALGTWPLRRFRYFSTADFVTVCFCQRKFRHQNAKGLDRQESGRHKLPAGGQHLAAGNFEEHYGVPHEGHNLGRRSQRRRRISRRRRV